MTEKVIGIDVGKEKHDVNPKLHKVYPSTSPPMPEPHLQLRIDCAFLRYYDRIHIRHLTIKMNRNNRLCFIRNFILDSLRIDRRGLREHW